MRRPWRALVLMRTRTHTHKANLDNPKMFRFVWYLAARTPLQMQTRVWEVHRVAAPVVWTTWSTFRSIILSEGSASPTQLFQILRVEEGFQQLHYIHEFITQTLKPPKEERSWVPSALSLVERLAGRISGRQLVLPAKRLHWQHPNSCLFARLLQLHKPSARKNDQIVSGRSNQTPSSWISEYKKTWENHSRNVWPSFHLQSDCCAPVHEAPFGWSASVTYRGSQYSEGGALEGHKIMKRFHVGQKNGPMQKSDRNNMK